MELVDCTHFLQVELKNDLEILQPETIPTWGTFTAQEMVEHLILALKLSYKTEFDETKSVKSYQQDMRLAYLYGNINFTRNIPSPLYPNGLPPLEFTTLVEARANLYQAIENLFLYFEAPENAQKNFMHPLFGKVNFEDIQRFHYKHFRHHLEQFGLLNQ